MLLSALPENAARPRPLSLTESPAVLRERRQPSRPSRKVVSHWPTTACIRKRTAHYGFHRASPSRNRKASGGTSNKARIPRPFAAGNHPFASTGSATFWSRAAIDGTMVRPGLERPGRRPAGQRSHPFLDQVGERRHKKRVRTDRRGADEIQAQLATLVLRLDVDVVQNLEMIGEKSNRQDGDVPNTRCRQSSQMVADVRFEPWITGPAAATLINEGPTLQRNVQTLADEAATFVQLIGVAATFGPWTAECCGP